MSNEEEPTPQESELTEKQRDDIVKAAGLGMPWRVIASLIMMSLQDLSGLRTREPDLAKAIRKAEADCMKTLLERLTKAEQWQAATFVLQSRWPADFGRNRKPRKKRMVEPPITQEMLNRLTVKEVETYCAILDKMHAAPDASATPEISALPTPGPDRQQNQLDAAQPAPLCLPGVEHP